MRAEDFTALDANNDGAVQLDVRRNSKASRKGYEEIKVEWPYRQTQRLRLPPNLTLERLLATFDKDGDKILTRKELKSRPDLLLELDNNGDGELDLKELKYRTDDLAREGVDITVEDFLGRWDLNGDGKVEPNELAVPAWLLTRLGLHTAK